MGLTFRDTTRVPRKTSSVSSILTDFGSVSDELLVLQWLHMFARCVVRCWDLHSALTFEPEFLNHMHMSWVMLVYSSLSLPPWSTLLFNALLLSVEPWLVIFVLIEFTPANLSLSWDVGTVTTKPQPCLIRDILLFL